MNIFMALSTLCWYNFEANTPKEPQMLRYFKRFVQQNRITEFQTNVWNKNYSPLLQQIQDLYRKLRLSLNIEIVLKF